MGGVGRGVWLPGEALDRVSGGPYVTVGCSAGTSFVDTGLTNGTTYYYVVSATYTGGPVAGGASANSSQVSATPQAATPQPPTGLTATPGNTQVSLSWTASSGATSYNVKRSTVSGGPYTTVGSTGATSFTNTGLTNGTTYFYVVTAVNASGESGNSTQVSATPQGVVPAPPTGVTATPGNAQVSLSWTASSGATSYNVKRATVSGGPYTTVGSHGRDELHQYRAHQRHDVLLRGHRGERLRARAGTPPGERHASGRRTGPAHGRHGDAGQHAGIAELERFVRARRATT